MLRTLWRARGGYETEIHYNPEIDLKEFGSQFGPGMFTAVYKFKIDAEGKWTADFDIDFNQNVDNPDDTRLPPPEGRRGPFYAQDYSRAQSNTVKRARRLAKPSWSDEEGRSGQDFMNLLNEEQLLNETVDFSFKLKYTGSVDWGNYADYSVKVSDTKREVIPEKDVMHVPEVATIEVSSITRRPTTSV